MESAMEPGMEQQPMVQATEHMAMVLVMATARATVLVRLLLQ